MIDPTDSTLTFELDTILVGVNNRRIIDAARPSLSVNAGVRHERLTLAPAGSRALGAVTKAVMIRTDGLVNVTVTRSNVAFVLAVDRLLVLTGALEAVAVTNPGTAAISVTTVVA